MLWHFVASNADCSSVESAGKILRGRLMQEAWCGTLCTKPSGGRHDGQNCEVGIAAGKTCHRCG